MAATEGIEPPKMISETIDIPFIDVAIMVLDEGLEPTRLFDTRFLASHVYQFHQSSIMAERPGIEPGQPCGWMP